MMLDTDVNSLEARKTDLEVELNNLLKSEKKEEDKINELRSEILFFKSMVVTWNISPAPSQSEPVIRGVWT